MNRLLVVRHGQTEWNIAGRIQGSTDIDLDATGQAQAAEAAPELAAYEPVRIISSDLRRAVDTARPIAELTGVEIELDKRLRERAYGPWEGLTQVEIAEQFPQDHRRWRAQEPLQHPDIETWGELHRRTAEAVRDIVESEVEGTAIVVCHGGSARQIIGGVLGLGRGVDQQPVGHGQRALGGTPADAFGQVAPVRIQPGRPGPAHDRGESARERPAGEPLAAVREPEKRWTGLDFES